MEWTEEMSVGIDELDLDHRNLLRLMNELKDGGDIEASLKVQAINAVFSSLIDYTNSHFQREESVMQASGYPYLENHRQVHRLYKQEVERKKIQHERNPQDTDVDVLCEFMESWFRDHIMTMDMSYKDWIGNEGPNTENIDGENLPSQTALPVVISQIGKLLVIDNEADICAFISHVARKVGYEAASIAGLSTIEELVIDDINIIVLDLLMPGVDGIEILRRLADLKSQIKIILISGHDAGVLHSAREIAVERGLNIVGHLAKPVSYDALQTMLTDARAATSKAPVQGQSKIFTREELQQAIDDREIVVFFQPMFSFASAAVIGVEALARWQHPQRGLISPALFIPLFEEHKLIRALTWLMLEQSLEYCAAWNRSDRRLQVAVNFSPMVLNDLQFPEQLAKTIANYDVDSSQITLEVTENAIFAELADALDILTRCRLKGFRLSIDDFGTGYSTMQQLMRVPYTEVKIDQSFVKHADSDAEAWSICESTIELGHKLGMNVIAEGIETKNVYRLLDKAGCNEGQGYYMSRPMPAQDFDLWLGSNK